MISVYTVIFFIISSIFITPPIRVAIDDGDYLPAIWIGGYYLSMIPIFGRVWGFW